MAFVNSLVRLRKCRVCRFPCNTIFVYSCRFHFNTWVVFSSRFEFVFSSLSLSSCLSAYICYRRHWHTSSKMQGLITGNWRKLFKLTSFKMFTCNKTPKTICACLLCYGTSLSQSNSEDLNKLCCCSKMLLIIVTMNFGEKSIKEGEYKTLLYSRIIKNGGIKMNRNAYQMESCLSAKGQNPFKAENALPVFSRRAEKAAHQDLKNVTSPGIYRCRNSI